MPIVFFAAPILHQISEHCAKILIIRNNIFFHFFVGVFINSKLFLDLSFDLSHHNARNRTYRNRNTGNCLNRIRRNRGVNVSIYRKRQHERKTSCEIDFFKKSHYLHPFLFCRSSSWDRIYLPPISPLLPKWAMYLSRICLI